VFDRICNTLFRVAILPYCLVRDKEGMRKRENRRVKERYIFKEDIQTFSTRVISGKKADGM